MLVNIMQRELNSSDKIVSWLLEASQPVARYYTLTELLDYSRDDPEVASTASAIPERGWAREILASQKEGGYWESPDSLYEPKYTATNWKALVLSDFALTKQHPQIKKTGDLFLNEWMDSAKENVFHDEVCIVGNTARMLTRFGYADDSRVGKLFDRLLEDQKEDGGWHCFPSEKGSLDCWEALAAYSALPESKRTSKIKNSIERGANFYLERKLYEDGDKKYDPWFRFHYPIHYYYDILVGLDVLTSLGCGGDKRLRPALEIMREKRMDGTWRMEKIHPDVGEGADYGPFKKTPIPIVVEDEGEPSKWLTLKALIIEKRVRESGA